MSRPGLAGRGMRGISVLAVAITLAGGLFAAPAISAAPPDAEPPFVSMASMHATQVTTIEQRMAAASTLNLQVTPTQARMTDLNFTIWIWKNAERGSAVKREAEKAFIDEVDENACYNFIATGIHTAYREDVRELPRREERHQQRLRAADVVGWIDVPTQDLDGSLTDFVYRLFEKAEDRSEVEAKAAAVLTNTSTDQQRQAFITEGIFAADTVDKQRRLDQAEREKRELDERRKNIDARAAAWLIVAKAGLTEELKLIGDTDFTWKVFRTATGMRVRAAAQSALDTADAAKIKAFIFTGVHTAHQADLADENAKDAAETEKKIKEILDLAKRDGYMPNLVAAAAAALAGDLAARHEFVNIGQYTAAKKDQIKPGHDLVVELQGKASGRCVRVAGVGGESLEVGWHNELWDCERAPRQIYTLQGIANGNEYIMHNLNSLQCLDGGSDILRQYPCDGSGNAYHRWTFLENADGTYQIKNVGTGKFITATDGGTTNGVTTALYANTNDNHQRWRLIDPSHRSDVTQITAGRYRIKGVQSGRCLQTAGATDQPNEGALANIAPQELWDCGSGDLKDVWDLVDLGNKKYVLKNVRSAKCLDVKYGGWPNGTQLVQFDCHHGDTEQFVFSGAASDGSYALENVLTGRVADAVGNAIQNGAWIGIWDLTGLANQRWTLVPVTQ